MAIHVYPLDDSKEHEFETTCDCDPSLEFVNGEMIVIHNSFDGREYLEEYLCRDGKLGEHVTGEP